MTSDNEKHISKFLSLNYKEVAPISIHFRGTELRP